MKTTRIAYGVTGAFGTLPKAGIVAVITAAGKASSDGLWHNSPVTFKVKDEDVTVERWAWEYITVNVPDAADMASFSDGDKDFASELAKACLTAIRHRAMAKGRRALTKALKEAGSDPAAPTKGAKLDDLLK